MSTITITATASIPTVERLLHYNNYYHNNYHNNHLLTFRSLPYCCPATTSSCSRIFSTATYGDQIKATVIDTKVERKQLSIQDLDDDIIDYKGLDNDIPIENRPPMIALQAKKSLLVRNVPNTIKLRIVHNEFDLLHMKSDQDDPSLFHTCSFNMESIKRTIYKDYYDEEVPDDDTMLEQNDYIEYLDEYKWKPIMTIDDISAARYKGGITPLQIRLSKYYPDDYKLTVIEKQERRDIELDTEKLRDELYYINDSDQKYISNEITRVIRALVILMKHEGYVRDAIKPYFLLNQKTHTEIMTRQYILHQATFDANRDLQSLLLNQPNALQHIINMIHYDFIWNKYHME